MKRPNLGADARASKLLFGRPFSKLGVMARSGPVHLACLALGVLVVVAAALALWFSVDWYRAEHDDDILLAETRDEVLRDAQQAAVNLNTLDFNNPEQGIELWKQSSTGDTLEEFETNGQLYIDTVKAGKRTTEGRFVAGAVTELDERAGTARAIVGLDVTVRPEGQPESVVRQRLQLQMTETDGGWKVSAIGPVGETGVPN